jgi:hypothetical protein
MHKGYSVRALSRREYRYPEKAHFEREEFVDVLDWSYGWTDAGGIAVLCSAYRNAEEGPQRYRLLIHSPDHVRAMSYPAIV